jgi:Ser/Thr protein kinase RdoA (MazF antagonist)
MQTTPFSPLHPEAVLNCVEQASGRRLLNVCRPHSSYINRVYEVQDEDGEFFIVKFFRPGRWSELALLDELQFVNDCAEIEIPVIPPMPLADGSILGDYQSIRFALYPRCGGRLVDEYNDEQWLELGRLLGRVHTVGAARTANGRNRLHPEHTTRTQVDFIIENDLIPEPLISSFKNVNDEIIAVIYPVFVEIEEIRIHGDCHGGNLIYRPGESFFIIDFDDMLVGPPVQDFWMLLPGILDDCRVELALLLEGYEMFRSFDRRTLKLIEPLRAMRFIHYTSWCGWQFIEDGETRIDASFGSYNYWQKEIADLEDQLATIRKNNEGC